MNKLINLRLNDALLKKIDGIVKEGVYSNRTEFIKHKLVEAIEDIETQEAIKRIHAGAGLAKRNGKKSPTNKELRKIREESSKHFLKKYGLE